MLKSYSTNYRLYLCYLWQLLGIKHWFIKSTNDHVQICVGYVNPLMFKCYSLNCRLHLWYLGQLLGIKHWFISNSRINYFGGVLSNISPWNKFPTQYSLERYHQMFKAVFGQYWHKWVNPFTLRAPPESIVCYFYTFNNTLGIKRKFKKYLKESCCLTSGQHFSIKYFSKNAYCSKRNTKIVRPVSAALSVNGLKYVWEYSSDELSKQIDKPF